MANNYTVLGIIVVIAAFLSSIFTAVGTIVAFKPRVDRNKDDIEKLDEEKADKTQVIDLTTLMNTRFDAQGREIGEIKAGVHELLKRGKGKRKNESKTETI